MQLRDYQERSCQAIFDYFSNGGTGNPIVALPTASGKSVVQAEFCKRACEMFPDHSRIVCLTHVKELLEQNEQKMLAVWPDAPAGMFSASVGRRQPNAKILFAGIQTVYNKAAQLGWIDLMMIDECFVADTMIETQTGARPIKSIRPGDIVANAFGFGTVISTSEKNTNILIEISDDHGNILRCTERHPIFTDRGWIKAGELAVGSHLYGKEELRVLQQRNAPEYVDRCLSKNAVGEELGQAAFLLDILRSEIFESDVGRKLSTEDAKNSHEKSAQANKARREWASVITSTPGLVARAWRWMVGGGCRQDERRSQKWRLSKCLQSGHWERGQENRNRDRWEHASRHGCAGGSKKIGHAKFSRVVSVSRIERESAEPVFNLHVDGHPSYFANGKLVHNCHLLPPSGEGQYQRFIADVRKYNPAVKIIGLTATPYRNGQGLLTDGDTAIFTDIILDLTQGEELVALIDAGYLAPLHPKRTDTAIDLTGVHTTGGDFNNGALQTACNKEEITDAAIDESLRVATGRASFLWFCAGVDHAIAVRDALRARGERCEMVSGATPMGERERILDDFKAHRLKHVSNANVLTTGFDHPSLDVIILLRPTKSASLHVQMLGRGMRIAMGKLDCLVLDFAGNTKRLGPINDIRIPKKKGAGGGVAPTKDCPKCKEILPTSVRECPSCGHEFPPPEPEITHSAATDKLIVRKEDKIRDYTVDDVRYSEHTPPGKRPSMKVSYECGFRTFHEWLHVGQPGFLGAKAANWWMKRSPKFCPPTLAEALAQADTELSKPLRIRVNENGKYPEIIAHFWSDESATD